MFNLQVYARVDLPVQRPGPGLYTDIFIGWVDICSPASRGRCSRKRIFAQWGEKMAVLRRKAEAVSVDNVDVVDVMVEERKKGGCFRVVKLLVLSTKKA